MGSCRASKRHLLRKALRKTVWTQTIPTSLHFMETANPAIDRGHDGLDTCWGKRTDRRCRSHHAGLPDNAVFRGASIAAVHFAAPWTSLAAGRETMRACMAATGCAAGFALSRGVSFQGFIPATPIIVSINQKMP